LNREGRKVDEGQCCKGNLERRAIQEEMYGATRMQQRHEEPRPKRPITSGKQENAQQNFQAAQRAGDREANSQVFCQDSKNECQNIVEEPAITQTKEETAHSLRARDGASATLIILPAPTRKEEMAVHL
jgi:hypothetical protein